MKLIKLLSLLSLKFQFINKEFIPFQSQRRHFPSKNWEKMAQTFETSPPKPPAKQDGSKLLQLVNCVLGGGGTFQGLPCHHLKQPSKIGQNPESPGVSKPGGPSVGAFLWWTLHGVVGFLSFPWMRHFSPQFFG